MHNVPWDVAFGLYREELTAYTVIVGELETGKKFDWRTYTWPRD